MSHTIKEIQRNYQELSKFVNLRQINDSILMLGDNPLLHRTKSNKFSDFASTDFIIALSSNRVYTSTKESSFVFNDYNAVAYNIAIIEQSVRYVCSEHLEVLRKSVDTYNDVCKYGLNHDLAERAFNDEYNYSP